MEIFEKILTKEVIAPILILLGSILLYKVLKKVLATLLLRHTKLADIKKQKTIFSLIKNILKYVIAIIALLMILEVYGIDTKAIIASLGVGAAVLGLAFQDLLKDFIAGIFIIFEDQYRVGDTVKINSFMGEVLSIGLKSTKIKAYTGEVLIISNRTITEVINYNMQDNLALIDVNVEYEENLEKVETTLQNLFAKLSKEIVGLKGDIELWGIEELGTDGIRYRVAAPCKPLKQYEIQRKIRKAIKEEFDQKKISIPYMQVVVHHE